MTGRPRSRSDKEILAAVARVVARTGVGGLTLAAVAAEVGLATSTVAVRFGSKRGLLLAASRTAVASVGQTFAAARERHDDPLDAAIEALVRMAGPLGDREAFAHNLTWLALDLTDPEFRAAGVAHADATRAELTGLTREAAAARLLEPDADAAALTRSLMVAYEGGMTLWARTGEGDMAGSLRRDIEAVAAPWRS